MNRLLKDQLSTLSLAVLGEGKTTESISHFLGKHDRFYWITDCPKQAGVLSTKMWLAYPKSIDLLITSPGFAPSHPLLQWAKRWNIPVVGDIALFMANTTKPVIGVTGTNGKSTLVTLIAAMLSAGGYRVGVGGNIGTPALSLLTQGECDVYVLELSSFQLWATPNLPLQAAVLLNLTPDHLDWHPSLEHYYQAKWRIGREAQHFWVSRTLQQDAWPASVQAQIFDEEEAANSILLPSGNRLAFAELAPALQSAHQVQNIQAAFKVITSWQISEEAIVKVLTEFAGLPYRCRPLGEVGGLYWFNDSKGTNVGATMAAVESISKQFPQKLNLLLGGVDKGQCFRALNALCKARQVQKIIIFGSQSTALIQAFERDFKVTVVTTLVEAVAYAKTHLPQGQAVLFSPACASFDQYQNYNERGAHFDDLVSA